MMPQILVLEDESILLRLLRRVLRQYAVLEASTAEEALQRFADNKRTIDLLIADVSLPDSSGVHVALSLRLENPGLPVILTSGYPVCGWCDRDYSALQRLGADSVTVIQKPFQSQVLLRRVRELIGDPRPETAVGTA
jgi:DNA-binding response OmpR family regulator